MRETVQKKSPVKVTIGKIIFATGLVSGIFFSIYNLNTPGTNEPKSTGSDSDVSAVPTTPAPTTPDETADANAITFTNPDESNKARELQVLFTTGAYRKAVELVDQFLALPDISEPFRQWLEIQMPILLGSAGWAFIAVNDCDNAIQMLRRAVRYFETPVATTHKGSDSSGVPPKTRADIQRGLGYCLKKSGNAGGAEDSFRQALTQNPGDRESLMQLVDVLETDGRFHEGVELLDHAATDDAIVKNRLKILRRRAGESDFQQTLRSPHFNITYRAGSQGELANEVARILEKSLDEFIETFGYREPMLPIDVLLYPRSSFSWMLGDAPAWAEGIFDGRMRIPVPQGAGSDTAIPVQQNIDKMTPVLRHELIHALNSSMTGGRSLPPWLEEGLAQRIGEMSRGSAFPFPVKPPPFMPVEKFENSYLQYAAAEAGNIYRQSLYLVLTIEYHQPEALKKIISNLSASSPTNGDSLLHAIDLTVNEAFRRARIYWRQRQPLAAR